MSELESQLAASDAMYEELQTESIGKEEENPFKLPSDDKIFRMREEEKKKKELDRQASRTMHVW